MKLLNVEKGCRWASTDSKYFFLGNYYVPFLGPLHLSWRKRVLRLTLETPKIKTFPISASLRCCVDGGMDRFLDFCESCSCVLAPPEVFTGDFDSCQPRSMDFAERVKCKIVKTPDQNETDFTKSLRTLSLTLREREIESVLVVCETSGRLDQIMANINTLFKSRKILPEVTVFVLSSNSLSWLLHPGSHVIHIPAQLVAAKRWCGLVPFTRTKITTSGLKWNMRKSEKR